MLIFPLYYYKNKSYTQLIYKTKDKKGRVSFHDCYEMVLFFFKKA